MRNSRSGKFKISGSLVVGVGLVLVVLYLGGFLKPTGSGVSLDTSSVTPPAGDTSSGFTNYNVGFTYQERNPFTGASESTTSPTYSIFHSNGRTLATVTSLFGEQAIAIASGSTATNVAIFAADKNIVFVRVDTGTAHYPEPARLLAANPYLTSCKWMPINSATINQLACEIDLKRLGGINLNINPSATGQLLVPALPDDLSLTLSAPANQLAIGVTGGTDVYVTWEASGITANEAFAFTRIWITSDQGSGVSEMQSLTITAPGGLVESKTSTNVGTSKIYSVAATSGTAAGVTQFWRFWPINRDAGLDYSDALLVGRAASNEDVIRLRMHIKTSFVTFTDTIIDTMRLRIMSAANAAQTDVTDAVSLGPG